MAAWKQGTEGALHYSRGHSSCWGSCQGHTLAYWSKPCTLEGKWPLDFIVEEMEAKINWYTPKKYVYPMAEFGLEPKSFVS